MTDQETKRLAVVLDMEEPDRSRSLMALAYELLIKGDTNDALRCYGHCDSYYFSTTLHQDMGDPKLRDMLMGTLDMFLQLGYITEEHVLQYGETGKGH